MVRLSLVFFVLLPAAITCAADASRLRRMLLHLVTVCELTRKTWEHMRRKTDDNYEWRPTGLRLRHPHELMQRTGTNTTLPERTSRALPGVVMMKSNHARSIQHNQ